MSDEGLDLSNELIGAAREGSSRALARLISLVEDARFGGSAESCVVMAELARFSGRAHVVGMTGSPGVGKSTTISALVRELRSAGKKVGVLAIDPSSPYSGGALLGDRVRMSEHALDEGVFIRSIASRGHLGGLSWTTPRVLRVLDAIGFEVVIVETVGVGQSEVEIAGLADTTVVLLAPGMGDGIQAAKAGILEIGDVYVVNKADREGASSVARDVRAMLAMSHHGADAWRPPVLKAVAANGEGLPEVATALEEHHAWLVSMGELTRRRERRARQEVETIALDALRKRWEQVGARERLDGLAAAVARGDTDPFTAAEELLG